MQTKPIRLAVIVTHPIQYIVPLYQRLAAREDLQLKVFYTWHDGKHPQHDRGFGRAVSWDIPLTDGYEHQVVANISRSPGAHHFWGLRNPELVRRVTDWRPNAVHITGYAYASHLNAIRSFSRQGVPVLFRGDSHLLNEQSRGLRWELKRFLLNRIYSHVSACLYVGKHNYDYYCAFGVPKSKLFYCPHSIDVGRFAEPNDELENKARRWREELRIPESAKVLLFAAKFEKQKRPLKLMEAVAALEEPDLVLVMVGNGELEREVQRSAAEMPERFRVLPFQNQSVMPVVYRLGDVFTLPSASETWGLAVNEALASGRRVLLSDRVGCAPDVVTSPEVGDVFSTFDRSDFGRRLCSLFDKQPDRDCIVRNARRFDISATEEALCNALGQTLGSSI